jgi:membrane associated rhomboid family serine protease/Flp pilus assembly protein TadD
MSISYQDGQKSVGQPAMEHSVPLRRIIPTPVVTRALVGINAAVFVLMVLSGVSPTEPQSAELLKWGANWGPYSLGDQPWRMLTSNYLHIGIIHIALNMWCLWDLGQLSEFIFGRWTLFLIYTACGLAGSIASLWWHPMVIGAGASGAIFGLAGALITALYLGKLPFPRQGFQKTLRSLLTFAGYNLLFGAVGRGIDNSAHVGGLVMGLALGAVIGQFLTDSPESRAGRERFVFMLAAIALVAAGSLVKREKGNVVFLVRASTALSKGQPDAAIKALQTTVAKNPKDNAALVLLGTAYVQKKDYVQAEAVLKRAEANDPSDPAVQYNLGLMYQATNRFEPARQIFSKLAQSNPRDDDVWMMLGSSLDGLGRESEAVQAYQRAVSLNPKNGEAYREMGMAYQAQGMKAEAEVAFKKASELGSAAKPN